MGKFWLPNEWNRWAKRAVDRAEPSVGETLREAGFDPESPIWHGAVATLAALGGERIQWEPMVPRDVDLWGELTVEGEGRTASVAFPAEVLERVEFRGLEIDLLEEGDPVSYTVFVPTAERVSEVGRWLQGEGTVADFGLVPHATVEKIREWLAGEPSLHVNAISKKLYELFDVSIPGAGVEGFLRKHRIDYD